MNDVRLDSKEEIHSKIKLEKFDIHQCSPLCFGEILQIERETFDELDDKDILREYSEEMLKKVLQPPHITLGAWYDSVLVGFSVLYYPQTNSENDSEDNLSTFLNGVDITGLKTANNKRCIVKKDFRGNSLQYELGCRLEIYAQKSDVKLMCATVSPKNTYSIKNIQRLGYIYNKRLLMYGSERNLYYKFIQS